VASDSPCSPDQAAPARRSYTAFAASSIGLLSYLGEHRFGLTGRGHLLRSDVPGSLRALALMQTANAHW